MKIRTYRGVQGLRFASALVVVAFHACHWFNRDAGADHLAPEIQLVGDLCVWTFFLISGFVVVHVVDSGRETDWKVFAIRRATRVLPLAWAMTLIKIGAAILTPTAMFDGGLTPTRIVSSLLLVPSRDPDGHFRTLWGVEWTLVFEAAFYMLVAVALAVRVDPVRFVMPIALAVAILSVWRTDGGSVLWFYADPVVLFLLVGMWIGRATQTGRVRAPLVGSVIVALLYGAVQALRHETTAAAAVIEFSALAGAFALVIAAERRLGHHIPNWVVLGGEASFAIYLTHPLVAQALPRFLGRSDAVDVPWWPVVLASVAMAVVLGWVVHRWVDTPFGRALRHRLVPGAARRVPRIPA